MSDDAPLGTTDETQAGPALGTAEAGPALGTAEDGPDAPLLADLMPWSVAPLRLGRDWVLAPDPASLRRRWATLVGTAEESTRAGLFGPSRARTLRSAVAPLPGRTTAGVRLGRESGGCPQPVRVLHGPYDRQWLIPDSRLIDAPRPELWRVTDERQIHLIETASENGAPPVAFGALLPDGHSLSGRPGRIRPLHRRPGGREPNLAPGLLGLLSRRLGRSVTAEDFLAWTAAVAQTGPEGARTVPLTADPGLWEQGVALGRRSLWLHTRGARCGDGTETGAADGPRMPGGRRPYVRAPLPPNPAPEALGYEEGEQEGEGALCVGDGRISPVDRAAWEYEVGGTRVLEAWYAQRTGAASAGHGTEGRGGTGAGAGPGTLAAVRPAGWPQEWTSELLELITVLTLLAELRPARRELDRELRRRPAVEAAELRAAGVLPPPEPSRRPASVLDLSEEGPDGQLALL